MTREEAQRVLENNQKNASKTGKAPPKTQKYYLRDYNANPGLAHVNTTLCLLDHTFEEATPHVLALHDSGCAKTIINIKIFDKLLEKGHIEVYQPERPTVIVMASGEAQPITGTADIMLHFKGLHGIQKSFQLNVIVHSDITQDFLFGRDFTGSDARAFETNKFLFLTDDPNGYLDSIGNALKNGDLCQVPI